MRLSVACTTFLLTFSSVLFLPSARALALTSDVVIDTSGLADLESRAEHAQTNEQAFLYTQLVNDYIDVAGRQAAAGDMDQATASLERVQSYADRIHAGLCKTTKRIKNAEMLMHTATYKLSQLMHVISVEDTTLVQATLKRLDKLHDELLQQVFSH